MIDKEIILDCIFVGDLGGQTSICPFMIEPPVSGILDLILAHLGGILQTHGSVSS